MAVKKLTKDTEKDFATEELILALPRVILVDQRLYSLRIYPIFDSKADKLEYAVVYRHDTTGQQIAEQHESPRQALLNCAYKLINDKFVAEITIDT